MFRADDPEHSGFALSHMGADVFGSCSETTITFEPVDRPMGGMPWDYNELNCTTESYASYTLETQHMFCDYNLLNDKGYSSYSFGDMIARNSIHFAVSVGACKVIATAVCGLVYACERGKIKSSDSGIVWESQDSLTAVEMKQTGIKGCVDFILHTAYRSFYLAKGLLFDEFFAAYLRAMRDGVTLTLPSAVKRQSLGTAVFQDLVCNLGDVYTQYRQNEAMAEWLRGIV